ncbi:MAG: glycosyltransferase family 2 protein [Cloacibacillus porcorum]|uniref:glycosyltransferase family 2 protein n=1 Tax=Cloacibacillus porcorum TaxID=1197717 RepID=UPI0023F2519E|nr:glycosyltransferase family 2 protein [Cloacibacillus porcorum]MCD7854968.1 glycosyltransferase family 2 protein [Clostridiales bacterium]MCD7875487.1 glycosyltransferase family 2 protein [Cloacibacillus porcorum]
MKKIDIIVPCYNEGEVVNLFYCAAKNVTDKITDYEIHYIFIDDGSTDNTLNKLLILSAADDNVDYISFSRNFGKEAAMYAGLQNSTGDMAVIMDADLQHPPELIPQMIEGIEEGYDCTAACRATRDGDSKLRVALTNRFYKLVNKISEVDMPNGAGEFRMMNRKMINAVLAMSEVQRFSKGIFSWVGFKTKWIAFDDVERAAGETKWNFWKLFLYAVDGITAFSTAPLRLASVLGSIISASAFIYLIYIILKTIIVGKDFPGYASVVTLILFIGGIIILTCGILGEYIAKIYMEVKRRPIYLVGNTSLNSSNEDNKDEG